ncbi:unnamed protein product, partial [Ceratitis capitata]
MSELSPSASDIARESISEDRKLFEELPAEMETRKHKMDEDRSDETEIRHVILSRFQRNLQLRRFSTRRFSIEDKPREGRPKFSTDSVTVALVKSKIDEDPLGMIANEL